MGYVVRGRCGHRIAIIRRVREDDDGDRDCVLGVRVYSLRSQNGDHLHEDYYGYCGIPQHGGGEAVSPTPVGLVTLCSR